MSAAAASSSSSNGTQQQQTPLVAQGDWIKNLVHLAKTAELKKHALTLQLQTAHILSAHASLDQKNKQIQDLKEQKNSADRTPSRLESERLRLLNCLREVNEDRDKADLLEVTLNKESVLSRLRPGTFDPWLTYPMFRRARSRCSQLQATIQVITDGEYATAKADVDRLRQELGQPPMPSLQATIEEKSQQYLKDLRLQAEAMNAPAKRPAEDPGPSEGQPTGKRPRGRPKGSKTKPKVNGTTTAQKTTTPQSTSASASGAAGSSGEHAA
ncbi:hypothetical protein BXZ70DRAFT_1009010 [Cristinia sonorae]|uniref:Uncharacterized protein n=1 Tax=Cristinia sonorae TaxID=1940300 RepID=A0A8K0UL99_9AGAR|nr:hypothetical protein BXZ70DRAFT_1009010 [Cristinia sonorae]